MGGIFDWIGKAFRTGAAGMAPNPPGSSSTERSYHGGNGKAAAVVATKMPGTPRREAGGHGREKAVQDPGLKDYVRLSFLLTPIFPGCVRKGALPQIVYDMSCSMGLKPQSAPGFLKLKLSTRC